MRQFVNIFFAHKGADDHMETFGARVTGVGALAEPVRRDLYLYVCAQPSPVSRDQAADALGVARHTAKFHLDKLVAEGLLQAQFARLSGRTGPGAGRPSKLYRRSSREIAVSLPDRQYALAGQLMADAIAEAAQTGSPILAALDRAARARGRAMGEAAMAAASATSDAARDASPAAPADVSPGAGAGTSPGTPRTIDLTCRTLAEYGYEPRIEQDRVVLANCPFHALAATHTELVCEMNRALIGAIVEAIGPADAQPRLEPSDHRCCVVLTLR